MEYPDLNPFFEPVRESAVRTKLPGIEESTSFGTPAMKVRGKLLIRLREPGVIVLLCGEGEKEFLKQMNPDVYFETDHYRGSEYILVRLGAIEAEELDHRLERAWRIHAGKKLLDAKG